MTAAEQAGDGAGAAARARWAVVLSGHRAVPPPGVDADRYGSACLADSYEVVAGLSGIRAALAGPPAVLAELEEIRWPQDPVLQTDGRSWRPIIEQVAEQIAELLPGRGTRDRADGGPEPSAEVILVAGDVPDLPELVIAKVAKALQRADVALAPELGGDGLAAAGIRLPWPSWLPEDLELDLDTDPYDELSRLAPRRNLVVRTPGWHRMRRPESVHRLDPGLEGWDNVRYLLTPGVR